MGLVLSLLRCLSMVFILAFFEFQIIVLNQYIICYLCLSICIQSKTIYLPKIIIHSDITKYSNQQKISMQTPTKQILILSILIIMGCCYKNTTQFWQRKLNITSMSYQSYAGYQQIDWYYPKNKSGMFYNLFGAFGHDVMNQSVSVPLVIWLQGGPGSGSQFGAFTQIGPVRIQKGQPKSFHSPWNIFGHLLFIDSPLNAGFSYYEDRHGKVQVSNTDQATNHLLNFLNNFYQQFSALKKSPLYITGQSFAGHYIPNLAKKILSNTTFINSTGIKLVGVGIGDGWTDPINQINFYDSFLWSVGVVANKFRDVCTWYQTHGIVNIYQNKLQNATNYFNFITDNKTTTQVYMGNISMYNFRNYDGVDRSFVTFLNQNKAEFGATVDYLSGNPNIYEAFGADISKSYASDVVQILKKIRVLIYNGQNDVVVNTAGVLQYLNGLNWDGATKWKTTQKKIWTNYGQVQGWVKNYGNLWFVLVNGAGHMVPTDQPQSAFSMFGHFITNDNSWSQ